MTEEMLSSLAPGPKRDPDGVGVLVLAYLGDTLHDLSVREHLVHTHDCSVHKMHTMAIGYVRAAAQSDVALALYENGFTDEERAVFRRGRNATSGTVPKNADVRQYRNATGFEAVLGWLYLSEKYGRLNELLALALEIHEKGEKA